MKVIRIDEYTEQLCRIDGSRSPIGIVGIVDRVYYNRNMKRAEAEISADGNRWIFGLNSLMEIK